jgi:hypothetical protein
MWGMIDTLLKNARIVLEASCRAQPGENVLIVVSNNTIYQRTPALLRAALELGLVPSVIDVRAFVASPIYNAGYILKPLKAAIESADIVINNIEHLHNSKRPDFSRLLGDPDAHDLSLTAERRWVYLTCAGMNEWNIDTETVRGIAKRTHGLMGLLRSAKQGRITSDLGTDLTFGLGPKATCTPVLGIVPLYGEVAIAPTPRATSGVFIVDGPTQLHVRPAMETDRAPLRITVQAGQVIDMEGDAEQIDRLREFIASGDPSANTIDEVGILTTPFEENDRFDWPDGTHHHNCVHVAIGNNERRDVVVHGPRHMDGEISKPTISIDGKVMIEKGVFLDEELKKHSASAKLERHGDTSKGQI